MIDRGVIVLDDGRIIELFWTRSESAISETAGKYGAYCTKIAHNILNNREDADECVNDTYLNVWKAIPPKRPERFACFLGAITRNLSLNKYKSRKALRRGGDEVVFLLSELEECIPAGTNVEQEYDAQETAEALNAFLETLEESARIVFVRRYWYGDSVSDIAERFRMSESKVKSMLFRTRGKLRQRLEKGGVSV